MVLLALRHISLDTQKKLASGTLVQIGGEKPASSLALAPHI